MSLKSMRYNVDIILEYKELILNESYIFIIEEMKKDLMYELIKNSSVDSNYFILNEFNNNKDDESLLNNLLEYFIINEGVVADISKAVSSMKSNFNNKHDKIVNRDKKWLNQNKKHILALNFNEIELEVLSDYKVTFEQLVNRHNIFDKLFVNSENNDSLTDKLRRFEDKNRDLKNGLDNYFRTGTSRREIGLRKVVGDEAKLAVENMIAYCESFMNGKNFLQEKLNSIIISVNDSKLEESYSIINILKEATEEIEKAINEPSKVELVDNDNKSSNDKQKIKDDESENLETNNDELDSKEDMEKTKDQTRGIRDRQIGIAVLLTVAEERYFDYINILKGLSE